MLGHVQKSQQPLVATALRQIFAAQSHDEGRALLADVAERLEHAAPKVARLLVDAEDELLAFLRFPRDHWTKLRSTNPLERVNREIGRRSDVVGMHPNDAALIRLAGALLPEQSDEWLVGRRYLSQQSLAQIDSQTNMQPSLQEDKNKEAASSPRPEQPPTRTTIPTHRDLTLHAPGGPGVDALRASMHPSAGVAPRGA